MLEGTGEPGTPPKQRRLPTKTRSGIISLPAKTLGQSAEQRPDEDGFASPAKSAHTLLLQPARPANCELDDDEDVALIRTATAGHSRRVGFAAPRTDAGLQGPAACSVDGCAGGCVQPAVGLANGCHPAGGGEAATSKATTNPGEVPATAPSPGLPAPGRPVGRAAAPARAGPGKSITGPLNSSSSPVVQSLPVKRRGSYQSLKKSTINSALNSEDRPSVLALVKKPTHWEKFGTILVLYCAAHRQGQEDGGVLQMMMAEGYDTDVVDNQSDALSSFTSKEVFPDMVIIDADHTYNTLQMIKQLQGHNPTVAVIVLGGPITRPGPISALQAGAADYVRKPPDVEELMARIERHVQRQHCIKLELEKALENVKNMMAQLAPASLLSDAVLQPTGGPPGRNRNALIAVAETDFEEQMAALSEENAVLGAKLRDMELSLQAKDDANRELESQLKRIDDNADGYGRRLVQVETQSATLMHKVDELQQLLNSERRTPS